MPLSRAFLPLVFALLVWSPTALSNSEAFGPHIRVELLSEHRQLRSGAEHWFGIVFEPDPHWHTYWLNPGDSGEPPVLNITLNGGAVAGELVWEIPKVIPVAHLINYGYERSLLMFPVQLPAQFTGTLDVEVELSWLVCKEDCIPGNARLTLNLPVYEQAPILNNLDTTEEFARARANQYSQQDLAAAVEITKESIALAVPRELTSNWTLLPFAGDWISHNTTPVFALDSAQTLISFEKSQHFWQAPEAMQWLAIGPEGSEAFSFTATSQGQVQTQATGILILMLMAFAGGLLLNLMPCVLPVLTIKAMSLAQATDGGQRRQGDAYAAGVILSFMGFAGIIELAKLSGQHLGWGFQMQSAGFVSFLALLFFALGLMLSDAIQFGGNLQNIGNNRLSRLGGKSASFMTGCLAVLVATPCTAPFMAGALGYALQSSALETFLIFIALAIGFALPLWLVHLLPASARLLPKPGAWMLHLKHLLAFPLLGTAIWLGWVVAGISGANALAVLLMLCLALAFCAYLSRLASKPLALIGASLIAALILLGGNLVPQSHDRNLSPDFSLADVAQLRADNQNVFVNVTADWCITCKVNEQVTFDTDKVKQALSRLNVSYVTLDWTRKDDDILKYLESFDRSGVPLYVYYPADGAPQTLPQVLTPDLLISYLEGETP
ncbi:thioredoxin family protein [Simiduia curdlanivorans]|uniref:Protein-disulfide reductase DsbD family protein n=1 Tax=Simiduia curdlanivorans TaxID=1492769 RepID=A0ABV8V6H5_9GAMM|nr:thioredoxin family protein [Simiduia curdlanivorans]MDN3638391.1 thioredoxin family protein [Simiduia curdlanivorans]